MRSIRSNKELTMEEAIEDLLPTDSFKMILAKTFATSAVMTAGIFVGLLAAGIVVKAVQDRQARKNPTEKTQPEN
jgi:hypothetical protein